MRAHAGVGALASVLVLALAPLDSAAQLVSADVRIATGPVSGRVVLGNHVVHRVVYRHARPVVVVDRYAPVVVVRRVATGPRGHGYGYWASRGYRRVVLYEAHGRFYDRWYRGIPGMREVVAWERHGRFYLPHYDVRTVRYDDRRDRYDRYDRREWYDDDRDDWYDDRYNDDRPGRGDRDGRGRGR